MPPVHCSFITCTWYGGGCVSQRALRDDPLHPWDQELRAHILSQHQLQMKECVSDVIELADTHIWDLYQYAMSAAEKEGFPRADPSIVRRTFERTLQVYNDEAIRSLMCMCCPQFKVDTGRIRSAIEFCSGKWLLSAGTVSLKTNFSFARYEQRFVSGTTNRAPTPQES